MFIKTLQITARIDSATLLNYFLEDLFFFLTSFSSSSLPGRFFLTSFLKHFNLVVFCAKLSKFINNICFCYTIPRLVALVQAGI